MHIFLLAAMIAFQSPEEEAVRRVKAHLLIEDSESALKEAAQSFRLHPESVEIQKALIESFAANGMEEEALTLWNQMTTKDPNLLYDRNLLENLAWGVLKKGVDSPQYGIRLAAMIGAFLTKDAKALPILIKMMRDSNAIIRSVAVQMASAYRDAVLKDEIKRLMKEEKVWLVKLQVIRSIGLLKMKEMSDALQGLVQSERTTLEERQIAIEALLEIYDKISLPELKILARSNRAGLRHLACSIAYHFHLDEAREEVIRLIQDPNPSVRLAALNAFGLLYKGEEKEIEAALTDSDPAVCITAAWAAMLIGSPLGEKTLEHWLFDSIAENRRLAAAALAITGEKGIPLAKKAIEKSQDPFVQANLALGLLGQRVEVKQSCDLIYQFLSQEKRRWMIDKKPNPLFSILAPSQVRYSDQIPNYPEAEDQMTRLHLVSQLALVEDPRAIDALKSFLKRKSWGITGVAAATLLHEGDDSALEIVKELTQDKDPDVRLQACFVLAMFAKDETVLRDLQGAYFEADHEKKLHILESIGKIGNTESFGFLTSVLKEPFPILRVAAAAAIIQSVNR